MYKTIKKSSKKEKFMGVFMDVDPIIKNWTSNQAAAKTFLFKFQPNIESIGRRMKQVKILEMAYDTPSVALHEQAKDLYILGYFFSSIAICRSTAEYLAFEIFFEEVEVDGEEELIKSFDENFDFRKAVNEYLYNRKKGYSIIDTETCKLFNDLYTLGNKWIHPKKTDARRSEIEADALSSIEMLGSLLSLRDVTNDFDISKGEFVKKSTARKKLRPIKLGHIS